MQIPGYTLIKKINSVGMATVYLATQHSVGRTVALKIMKPSLDQDPEFLSPPSGIFSRGS